jgi:hypothetical protein
MTPAKNRGLMLAFGGALALLAAMMLAYRPVTPKGLSAKPESFSAARALEVLKDLVGDDVPHPIGSPANARVRALVVKRFQALGYEAQLQSGIACTDFGTCGFPTNIVATLGNPERDNDAILLAAHYDSVPAGPGASDDGVGVAAVLEIARILKAMPAPARPIVLLVTDGEEAGLLGAELFVREHPLAKKIGAAVNMDSRGVSGPSLMFETGSANAWLMHLYSTVAKRPITNSLFYVVYKALPNDTDFTVFKSAAYQGFNLAFIGDVSHYHTPLDNFANASASSMQHQGDNALNALLGLAHAGDLHPPPGESLFFDVLARAIVALPSGFALPAALAALVLLLLETTLLLRARLLVVREALWGSLAALATPLLSAALSIGVIALLRAFGALPPLGINCWIAHPLAMNMAAPAMAVGVAGAVGWWGARRAGFWGFWFGAAVWIVLLSVAVAIKAPGASYIPLLTALAAVLAALPCAFSWLRRQAPDKAAAAFAILIPWFTMLALLIPVLLVMYPALGAVAWSLSALTLGFAASLILPLLARAAVRARRLIVAACAALIVGCVLVTLMLPVYTGRSPQRVNVEYWFDSDADLAHWWVYAASARLPTGMAAAANFDSMPRPQLPGSSSLGFFGDAPKLNLAAPELTQTSAAPAARPNLTHYELRLKSIRGAREALVVFPESADVENVVVAAVSGPLRFKLRKMPGGTRLLISGIPEGGLPFEIDATSQRIPVQVLDQSFGLPEALPQGTALQHARGENATSSQDGDSTVVQRTVWLDPAAGR